MINSERIILYKTGHDRGRIHDYDNTMTPLQVENILDLGYTGVQNDFLTVKYVYCHLERKGKRKLNSNEEKRHNREFQTKGLRW